MAMAHGGASAPSFPYAENVRHVASDEPFRWLAAGWRDFTAAPLVSLGYGLVFVVIGLALSYGLWQFDMTYMQLPLAAGFMLLGPALTIGFQSISRDLERGDRPSLARALTAWRANPGPILNAGIAFMFFFLLWLRLSQIIFALAFPLTVGSDAQQLVNATLFTTDGLAFLGLFVGLGAIMAALAFAGGAFALPMLLDRNVGMIEAIATSYAAVMMNLRTMVIWAALLVILTVAGMALFYVGLAITLPLAGHATWHAYRAVIRPGP